MDDSSARDALARHRRYQEDVVERYAVCPWAKDARERGRIRSHVVLDREATARALRPLVERWAEDSECDVGFIIAPRFDAGIVAFEVWTAEVAKIRSDVFLSAPFHPNAPPDAGVVRFLRQTPDPTVQLVRRSRLEEVRAQDPPHYRDIFGLDLSELKASNEPRAVATAVLAHNTRVVAKHRETLARLFAQQASSAPARDEAPERADD